MPGLKPEMDGEAERFVRRLTGDNASHVVSYGTEAGQFQSAGYSAVVCGPGDIAQAHQPDEFITLDQFQKPGRRSWTDWWTRFANDPCRGLNNRSRFPVIRSLL